MSAVKFAVKLLSRPVWLPYLFLRAYLKRWTWSSDSAAPVAVAPPNRIREYFEAHRHGAGIWKWNHYFEMYDRHLRRFCGQEVHVLEIGIYSGGSLEMWRQYFGPKCRVYGVDVEEACKSYEREGVRVFVGDQADRGFWRRFFQEVPRIDVVIDDGGHSTRQQIITLEETLPRLSPGGVYVCEDVHGPARGFTAYVGGLVNRLNVGRLAFDMRDQERAITASAQSFQAAVHSIHHYPFATVIERQAVPVAEFVSPKHGTEWQPFA